MTDAELGYLHALQSIIDAVEERTGLVCLRNDARLYLQVKLNPGKSVKDAMLMSKMSYSGFYLCIEKLERAGLVEIRTASDDARVRLIY